jgi:hypothetical protein
MAVSRAPAHELIVRSSRYLNPSATRASVAPRGAQGACGVDQRDVTEGLGKVADQPAGGGVVLLGEQADVVAQGEQPVEGQPRLFVAAHQGVAGRQS